MRRPKVKGAGPWACLAIALAPLVSCTAEEKPQATQASAPSLLAEGLVLEGPWGQGHLALAAARAQGAQREAEALSEVVATWQVAGPAAWSLRAGQAKRLAPARWGLSGGVQARHPEGWRVEAEALTLEAQGDRLLARGPLRVQWGALALDAQGLSMAPDGRKGSLMGRVRGAWVGP